MDFRRTASQKADGYWLRINHIGENDHWNRSGKSLTTYLASEVQQIPASAFKDKIVLIGSGLEPSTDTFLTPYSVKANRYLPAFNIELHGAALNMILVDRFLSDLSTWQSLLFSLVYLTVFGILFRFTDRLHALILPILFWILLIAIAVLGFIHWGLVLPVVLPATELFVLSLILYSLKSHKAQSLLQSSIKYMETILSQTREDVRQIQSQQQWLLESDRRRIAREFHDEMGQLLFALKLDIEQLQDVYLEGDPEFRKKTSEIKQLITTTIRSARDIISDIKSQRIEKTPLNPLLRRLLEDFENRTSLLYEFHADEEDLLFTYEQKLTIYRFVQEALNNVVKHARASSVRVRIRANERSIRVNVTDNGIGMEKTSLNKKGSYGLRGFRERIGEFGGTVGYRGMRKVGTCVALVFPRLMNINDE